MDHTNQGDNRKRELLFEQFLGMEERPVCPKEMGYLSKEEEEILLAMREVKAKARLVLAKMEGVRKAQEMDLKVTDAGFGTLRGEMERFVEELGGMRKQWKQLELRLEKARARKLAILGHSPWEEVEG